MTSRPRAVVESFGDIDIWSEIFLNRYCDESKQLHTRYNKKLSWCWQTRATRLEVTLSLRRAIFPIFDFKNAMNLKTGLWSVKVIGNITIRYSTYDFLLTFYSNYGSIFWDIQCRKMSWPWNRVRGHSLSLKVVSFGRLCMVSYWCSLVTLSLKCTVLKSNIWKTVLLTDNVTIGQ